MKLQFAVNGPVSEAQSMRNIVHANTLGLKTYRDMEVHTSRRLAIVGGGPSLREHERILAGWTGDIWAINGAWQWCREHGITATFYTVDAHPMMQRFVDGTGIDRALLCTVCDPKVFESLRKMDAEVFTFDVHEGAADRIINGTSTATTAPMVAIQMGYREVVFFGCEGSFFVGQTHTYQNEYREDEFVVKCGEGRYRTAPDYYFQAMEVASLVMMAPHIFSEQSGGLLRAFVENKGEHDIVSVSKAMAPKLKLISPDEGTEQPFSFVNGALIHPGDEARP